MTEPRPRSIRDLVVAFLLASLGIGSISVGTVNVEVNRDVTPVEARYGWDASLVDHSPPTEEFRAFTAKSSSEGAVVKLWDFAKSINGGQHFPTYRQLIGDCVANSWANGINYGQASSFRDNPDLEFRPACRQWLYGVGRTDPEIGNGRLGRGDGSVGDWTRRGAMLRGVLPDDEATGADAYNAENARLWGFKGPPKKFYSIAAQFKLESSSKVRTYEDARDALASGYPVPIASQVGFEDKTGTVSGGKLWLARRGSWSHAMCLIAIDDTAVSPFDGRKGAAFCLNSWGAAYHPAPVDDAPPGGFWIDRTSIEKILAADDSWAVPGFDGFKVRDLNFNVFGSTPDQDIAHFPTEATPLAPLSEALCGLQGGYAQILGGSASLASALTLLMAARRRRRSATTLAA